MSDREDRIDGSVGRIRELLGEMSGTVRSINEALREHKAEFRTEIRSVKDDQRQIEQAYSKQMDLLNQQVRDLERSAGSISSQVTNLASSVDQLKGPVDELNDFKQRLFTYGAVAATIFGIASYVLGPFISELLKTFAKHLFG